MKNLFCQYKQLQRWCECFWVLSILRGPRSAVNHLVKMTHTRSPPSASGVLAILYLTNGFLAGFTWALCYAAKVAGIPEPEKAVDKSTKVRRHPCWKLLAQRGPSFTLHDSFNDAWTKMPCHGLAEGVMGKMGRELALCAQSCVGGGGSGDVLGGI